MTVINIVLVVGISLIGGAAAAVIGRCCLKNKELVQSNETLKRANAELQAEVKRQTRLCETEYRQVYVEKRRAERDEAKVKIYDLKQKLRALN